MKNLSYLKLYIDDMGQYAKYNKAYNVSHYFLMLVLFLIITSCKNLCHSALNWI